MTSVMLKQTKTKILLSLNAAAILVAGVLIAGAIWLPKETTLRVVSERSDVVDGEDSEVQMIDSVSEYLEAVRNGEISSTSGSVGGYGGGGSSGGSSGGGSSNAGSDDVPNTSGSYSYVLGTVAQATEKASSGNVPSGELWNETSTTLYQSADKDICIDSSLGGLGDMYWQTSNTNVIAGFYATAREKLGYSTSRCRYPKIVGTGTTTITAGTYDGLRRDDLTVTVIAVPTEQWKREVLALVNQERAQNGLGALSWGSSCEAAAQTRAVEIISSYSHTRPDGSSWSTACAIPSYGGTTGENLAAGNTTTSPASVVATWMASETHRANILNGTFTNLAVGFVFDPSTPYRTYWSQIFSTF
ncbi:CAP domain-containing protein [Candidatus Saccharibacteria bacterium]|nr:CAP domain-containing protein [Candidatus Saccharibacteria bacterium]